VPTRPRHSTNTDGAFGVRGAGDANPWQISGAAAPPLGCAARTLRSPCLLSVDLPLVGDSHVQSCCRPAVLFTPGQQARAMSVDTSRGRSCHRRLQLKTVLTENAAGISSAQLRSSLLSGFRALLPRRGRTILQLVT
jgi:hypothetical protein